MMGISRWWEKHIQPGMLFVSKTHVEWYCGAAHVPGAPGSLLDPGDVALVVEVEPVAGDVIYTTVFGPGRVVGASFLSMFVCVEGSE